MHCGKKWWIREFVLPYIFPLNPDYVAARSLRSLRINNNDDDDDDCGTVLCSMFMFFGSMKYYYNAYSWQKTLKSRYICGHILAGNETQISLLTETFKLFCLYS